MKFRVLEDFAEIDDFKIEWNQLLFRSLDNHPFLTYEWLVTWWKYFGKNRELKLFIADKGGAVSLIAPLMYSTYDVLGVKLRKVEFIATPDSDYHVFILTDFHEARETVKPMIENIMKNSMDTELIELKEIPEDSHTAKLFEGVQINNGKVDCKVVSLCPYVALPDSYQMFLQTQGANLRRNLKRWEKQALKDYRIEFAAYDKIGNAEEAMRIFFELHQKRWASAGKPGLFSKSINRDFHLNLAKVFAQRGWLALFFLTFNGEPVSATYCYEYNGKLYAYLTGFDPEYAIYRPGYLTFKGLIRYGVEKGLREFDFMRGDEEYKTRWKTKTRRNFEFRLFKKGFKTTLYNQVTDCKALSFFFRKICEKMRVHQCKG